MGFCYKILRNCVENSSPPTNLLFTARFDCIFNTVLLRILENIQHESCRSRNSLSGDIKTIKIGVRMKNLEPKYETSVKISFTVKRRCNSKIYQGLPVEVLMT